MQQLVKQDFSLRYAKDHEEILKYLHLGTSLPILEEFHEYILGDLKAYEATALLLEEAIDTERFEKRTDNVTGITLLYDDGGDTLYFGFCGVYDHDKSKIELLAEGIINHAQEHDYSRIRGPINVPTMIYGWGFMVEGSNKDLFVGCPVNPPIYQEVFKEKGFFVRFEEDRYDVIVFRMDPHKLKRRNGEFYDFSDYEYINPGAEGMPEVKEEYITLHRNFMPPSAQITPNAEHNYENLCKFIFKYGNEHMMWIVRHKETKKMVANGYIVPNPFEIDRRGRCTAASFHDWVVHGDHQRNGLAMLMYGSTSLGVYRKGLRWGSWPVGAENEANAGAAKKMGGKRDRTHLILELEV